MNNKHDTRNIIRFLNQNHIETSDDTEVLYLFHQVTQEIKKRGLLKGTISR